MENINFLQIIAFSSIAFLIGLTYGRKAGFVQAIRSIPITVLKIDSESLTLEEQHAER